MISNYLFPSRINFILPLKRRKIEEFFEPYPVGLGIFFYLHFPPSAFLLSFNLIARFSRRVVTLEDCLNLFASPEGLTGEESYFCEHCKQKRDSEKQMLFLKLPDVLCLHIKRFRHDSYWSTKISDHVQLPEENLRMQPFCVVSEKPEEQIPQEDMIYDLVSITNHSGALGGFFSVCFFHFFFLIAHLGLFF